MHTRAHDPSKEPSKSAATPVPNQFQSRPFEVQAQPESSSPQQQETPYSQEQQERAERYGYNFANVRVFAPQTPPGELPTSPSIQPKLTIKPVQTENSSLVDTSKPSHPFFERMYASNQQRQPQAALGKVEPIVEYIRQSAIAEPQSSQNHSAQQQQETPDVQTQQQRTSHVGFNFANVAVHPNQSQEGKEDLPWRWLQPKLVVGQPGDKYEQEADLMAQRVMSMTQPANPQAIQRSSEGEDEVQRSPLAESITPLIQRSATEEQEIQTQLWLQKADLGSKFQATAGLESRLAGERGGGSPLDEEVKGFMEPRFGNDFSSVRIHTGSNAVQMNQELQAQAFTHGSDVYFNEGKYNPGSNEGKQLLAHELTHVVQQTGAKKLQRKPLNSRLENKETRLAKEQHQLPGSEEQEKELIQAKELPSRTPATTLNKELPPQPIEQEEEKELHQVKQISGRSSELSPELTEAPPQAALAIASERTGSETKPQTEAGAKSAPKPQATTEAPTTVAAETDSVAPEAALKRASEPVVSEAQASANSNIAVEKAPPQASPTPGMGAVPKTQSATPSSSAAATQTAQAESSTPPAQQELEASAGATSAAQPAAAAPTMESSGGSAEESSAMETPGAAEESQIEAAAAEVPPGSAELDSSDKAAALASLAEGSGGGGASAGGGGGGGGVAIPDKPTPPAPDVSQAEPSAALAAVSNLPPAQLMAALGGVGSAVGNSVGKQRAELAANPPQMESPSGSPKTNKESAAERQVSKGKDLKAVEKTPEGQAKPVPQPKPLPLSSTPPAAAVPQPQVKGDAEGKLDSGDAQKLQASLRSLPTRDPGLQQVSAGAPPRLELEGNADPQQAQQQRAELEKGVTDAHVKGQQDLAQPMGENEIYPQVPQETLRAEGIGGGGGGAGGAAAQAAGGTATAGGGAGGDDAVSIIAQQEHSQEIQAGVAQAQTAIAAKRQEHTTQVVEEKARSNQEIAKLQEENSAQQTAERAKAQTEVQQQRDAWKQEQDTLITKSRQDADAAVSKGNKDVQQEQTQAESKAAEHIQKGEEEAAAARQKGEEEAEKERQKGDKESGGIFGWLADKAKAFFDGIKQAIQKAFEVARAAVKAAIEGAQKLATAVIETARTAIVGIIKVVGQALIAIGDVLLAAFPEMRDRFRNAMKAVVKAAEAAVNTLANTLKKGVQTALNLLGKGLDAALGLLEKGMKAAVDIAKAAVQGAIKLADAAIKAVGAFAVLVKDIAGNPGQWLSNLGAGANDGIKNHFWGAFQTAVKEWFSQKVEEVLGLGMTVWNVLKQGGINTAEVGKMAWEGIKSAIPAVLIGILIEKVVSMIVPAAGTVLLIIEGLQAAWGTVSRILQAFDRFMAFLKAVKTGQAGPPFGAALAAAGVVVIDFVSNWLLKRLRGPASKVAGKIKEIAKKIGKKVKKAVNKLKRKLKRKVHKLKDKFSGKKRGKGDKKQKPGQEKDDPKKLKPVAEQASRAGWNATRKMTQSEVKQESEVKAALTKVKEPHPAGVKVKLELVNSGSTWKVKASASHKGKQANAVAGQGWIAQGEGGKRWYAAKNNEPLHKQIIKETTQKLKKGDSAQTGLQNLRQSYQEKVKLGQELQQQGQQRLDNSIKGIKYSVKMEDFSGVESDNKIKTQLHIRPNATEIQIDVALEPDSPYVDIALKLRNKAQDVRAEYIIKPAEEKGKTLATHPELATTGNVAVAVVNAQTGQGREELEGMSTTGREPMPIPTGDGVKFPPKEDVKGTKSNQLIREELKAREEQQRREREQRIKELEDSLKKLDSDIKAAEEQQGANSQEKVINLRKERSNINKQLSAAKQKQSQPDSHTRPYDPKALNDTHSEYRIFNNFATKLHQLCTQSGISPNDLEGTLHLYTERQMCTGCKLTADGDKESFEAMFPKIKVIVFYTHPYRDT